MSQPILALAAPQAPHGPAGGVAPRAAGATRTADGAPANGLARRRYLVVLTWSFTLFSSIRVLSYLPTLWALVESGQSQQHSLWTWGLWACSNVTMAAWLYEEAGQTWSRAVAVNALNASMCAAVFVVIAGLRI